MSSPTPPPRGHLRLVDGGRRDDDADGAPDFDAVDRPVHDLHGAYHEIDDDEIIDADFAGAPLVDEDGPKATLSPRFVVVALIAFQLLAALGYGGKYVTLARGGDVYGVAALLSVPGSLCLYVGAALLALRPGRGRALFVVAAVALGLSIPAWGIQYGWSWPMAFGSMMGLAGAWFARPEIRPSDEDAAQP